MRDDGDREPVLRSALNLRRRALWLGELALYEDRLTIAGWTWSGAVHEPVPIDDIRRVEKRPTLPRAPNFVIRPEDRRDFYCQIPTGVFYWVKAFRDDERTKLEVQH
jgi:hypothetical protein